MIQGHDTVLGWAGMWIGPLLMFVVPLIVVGLIVWSIRSFNEERNSKINRSSLNQGRDQQSAKGDADMH